jgi:hypothetical protein
LLVAGCWLLVAVDFVGAGSPAIFAVAAAVAVALGVAVDFVGAGSPAIFCC